MCVHMCPALFHWKSEGCVHICLARTKECAIYAGVCACVCDRSAPAASCLTAVAEAPGEAVKTQPNKPCVSSTAARHYAPPQTRCRGTDCVCGGKCVSPE